MALSGIISTQKLIISNKINNSITQYFKHRRGLRQGDLLSTLLFIIVTDSLQWFIKNIQLLCHHPVLMSPQVMQYADDTILILEAHAQTLGIVSTVLDNYALMSGLKINSTKSSFVPISMPQCFVQRIEHILHCTTTSLPLLYLGLLLSAKKLPKVAY
jgi:Reverse transcriptase (RNA-dependent DNA polymerase)